MTKKVLIAGASGRSGSHAAKAFAADGWSVRKFKRGEETLSEAAQGVDVIFNGLNPPNYQDWETNVPRITKDVIQAAKASGATIVVPGNVYVFGNQSCVFSSDTARLAETRKGKIRIEMEQTYRQAALDGVQIILLRAGDFIDPDRQGDAMELVYFRALKKNVITYAGDVNAVRAHCYLPDFAKAAVMLANKRLELARFEDIPFEGHNFSMLQLKAATEDVLGEDFRFKPFPWWMIRMFSPVWTLGSELLEMRYLWSLDHQLDGARVKQLLPTFEATELQNVIRKSIAKIRGEN